ncbi:hypothetical protein D3C81_1940030 [compost metagenome]
MQFCRQHGQLGQRDGDRRSQPVFLHRTDFNTWVVRLVEMLQHVHVHDAVFLDQQAVLFNHQRA